MINKNNCISGISLIEIMLAIFIISIIAMFGIPTYKNYLLKINRIEAKSALYDLANKLENHYSIYKTYENATIGLGKATDVLTNATTINNHYILSIINASNYGYTIKASLQNPSVDTDCIYFSLDNTGSKKAAGTNNFQCW